MWKAKIRELFPSLFLLTNSISWFSLTWFVISDLIGEATFNTILLVSSSYFGALIASAIIGATLIYNKLRENWAVGLRLRGCVASNRKRVVGDEDGVFHFVVLQNKTYDAKCIKCCKALRFFLDKHKSRG